MLKKIVSGGQTGVDFGSLLAAKEFGLQTGGYAPQGWHTEDGPRPDLKDFGLIECVDPGYPARTWANVRIADLTIWIGDINTAGYRCTDEAAVSLGKPLWASIAKLGETSVDDLAKNLHTKAVEVLNVAGNRESKNPGIEERTRLFLLEVFRQLRELGGC